MKKVISNQKMNFTLKMSKQNVMTISRLFFSRQKCLIGRFEFLGRSLHNNNDCFSRMSDALPALGSSCTAGGSPSTSVNKYINKQSTFSSLVFQSPSQML